VKKGCSNVRAERHFVSMISDKKGRRVMAAVVSLAEDEFVFDI
jgi:hypothetical protein